MLISSVIVYAQLSADPRGVVDIKNSPDGQLVAYSYYDSGGGGAGYCSFGVSIIRLGGMIKPLTFHAGQDYVFEATNCDDGYDFEWATQDSKSVVHISCPSPTTYIRKRDTFGEIEISYSNCSD